VLHLNDAQRRLLAKVKSDIEKAKKAAQKKAKKAKASKKSPSKPVVDYNPRQGFIIDLPEEPTPVKKPIDIPSSIKDTPVGDVISDVFTPPSEKKAQQLITERVSPSSSPKPSISITPIDKFKHDIATSLPGKLGEEQVKQAFLEKTSGISQSDWKQLRLRNQQIDRNIQNIDNTINTIKQHGGWYYLNNKRMTPTEARTYLEQQRSQLTDLRKSSVIKLSEKTFDPSKQPYSDFLETYSSAYTKSVKESQPDYYQFVKPTDYSYIVMQQTTGRISKDEASRRLNTLNLQGMQSYPKQQVINWGKQYLDFDPKKEEQQTFSQLKSKEPAATLTYDSSKPEDERFGIGWDYAKAQREEMEKLPWYGKVAKGALDVGTQFPTAITTGAGYAYRGLVGQKQPSYEEQLRSNIFKGSYGISQAARRYHETGDIKPYLSKTVGLESPFTTDILLPVATGGALTALGPAIGAGAGRAGTYIATKSPTLAKIGTKLATPASKIASTVAKAYTKHPKLTSTALTSGFISPFIAPTVYGEYISKELPTGTTAEQLARIGIGLASFSVGAKAGLLTRGQQTDLRITPELEKTLEKEVQSKIPGSKFTESPSIGTGRKQIYISKRFQIPYGDVYPIDINTGAPLSNTEVINRLRAVTTVQKTAQPTGIPSYTPSIGTQRITAQLYAKGEIPPLQFEGQTIPPGQQLIPIQRSGGLVPSEYYTPFDTLYNRAIISRAGQPTPPSLTRQPSPIADIKIYDANTLSYRSMTPSEYSDIYEQTLLPKLRTGEIKLGKDYTTYKGSDIGLIKYPKSKEPLIKIRSVPSDKDILQGAKPRELTPEEEVLTKKQYIDFLYKGTPRKSPTGQIQPYQSKLPKFFDLGPGFTGEVKYQAKPPVKKTVLFPKSTYQSTLDFYSLEQRPLLPSRTIRKQPTVRMLGEDTRKFTQMSREQLYGPTTSKEQVTRMVGEATPTGLLQRQETIRPGRFRRGPLQEPETLQASIEGRTPPTSMKEPWYEPQRYGKELITLKGKPTEFISTPKVYDPLWGDITYTRIYKQGAERIPIYGEKETFGSFKKAERLEAERYKGRHLQKEYIKQTQLEKAQESLRKSNLLKKYKANKRISELYPDKYVFELKYKGEKVRLVWEGSTDDLIDILNLYDQHNKLSIKTKKTGLTNREILKKQTIEDQIERTLLRENIDIQYVDGILIASKFKGMPNIWKPKTIKRPPSSTESIFSSSGPGTIQVLKLKKETSPLIKKPKIQPKRAKTQRPLTPEEQRLLSDIEQSEQGISERPDTTVFRAPSQKGRLAYDTRPKMDIPVRSPMKGAFFALTPISEQRQQQTTFQKQFRIPQQGQYFSLTQSQLPTQADIQAQSQDQTQIQIPEQKQSFTDLATNIQSQSQASAFTPFPSTSIKHAFTPLSLTPKKPKTKEMRKKKKTLPYDRYTIRYDVPDIWKAPLYTKQLFKKENKNNK